MGRKAVDTRKFNKVGTRKLFGRILIAFMLVAAISIALLGRIAFLGKAKGTEAERKVLAQQSYRSNEIKYKRGILQTGMGTGWQPAIKFMIWF